MREKLEKCGSPTTIVDNKIRNNALHMASKLGLDNLIHKWLGELSNEECQAILDTTNYAGNTALHLAALFGRFETLKVLLAYGANPNLVNQAGRVALEVAALGLTSENQKPCVKVLLEKTDLKRLSVDVTGDSLALSLTAFDDGELLSKVLRKNPDLLHMRDRRDQNLLHRAILNQNLNMVHYLLEQYPCLLEQQTSNGSTALHLACSYDKSDNGYIIHELMQQRSCREPRYLTARNEDSKTASMYLEENLEHKGKKLNMFIEPRKPIPFDHPQDEVVLAMSV